jgi:hypothetical protein
VRDPRHILRRTLLRIAMRATVGIYGDVDDARKKLSFSR